MLIIRVALLVPALWALLSALRRAYIDPTSGGLLIQVLLGGAAGFAVLLRLFGRRIQSLLQRGAEADDTEQPAKP